MLPILSCECERYNFPIMVFYMILIIETEDILSFITFGSTAFSNVILSFFLVRYGSPLRWFFACLENTIFERLK